MKRDHSTCDENSCNHRPRIGRRVIKRHRAEEARRDRAEYRYWQGRHDWATATVAAMKREAERPKVFLCLDAKGMRLEFE